MKRSLFLLVLCSLAFMPVAAQSDDVILQLGVPFFAEDFLQTAIEEFETQNPGIQVELVVSQGFGMPNLESDDPEDYQDDLAEYFSSADVVLVDNSLTPDATRAGYVLDLSPITSSDPAFNTADFHDALLRSFEWDGGRWALPVSTSFITLSYNLDAFDEAGLSYPTSSWTLADLEFAARTLTQYDAEGKVVMPGLVVGGGDNLAALFRSLIGQGVYNAAFPSDPDFSNSQIETLLDTWLQMVQDGIMNLPEEYNPDDLPMSIGQPQAFTVRFGGGAGNAEVITETVRAAALLPGGGAGLEVNGYAVSSGSAYPEESYALAKFLISHPDVISVSGGSVPALTTAVSSADDGGQGGGPGGGPAFFTAIPLEIEPILDEALLNAIPLSEMLFMDGVLSALETMQSDGVDARTALDEAQSNLINQLEVADTRASTTQITVQAPNIVTLAEGEIALDFAVLAGGPGFAVQQQWEDAITQFVEQDAEVGQINLESENQNQADTVAETYDCFYADSNLVPDLDLSLVLNLDPLFSVDPSFDRNDYVAGVLEQVQENGQTWALPLQISPLLLRYNPDLFNAAGVITPQANWTVTEFEDALRNLQGVMADGEAPLVLNASSQMALLTLIAAYGGLPIDFRTDPPTLNFTDPQTANAIQQVLDLVSAGYISYQGGGVFIVGFGGGIAAAETVDIPIYSSVLNDFGFGGRPGGGPGGPNQINTANAGFLTFPRGTQYNAVPFNLGTAYISRATEHADACYRFINYIAQSNDLFDAMPVRHSQINDPELVTAQGEGSVAFYQSLADLIADPSTIVLPTNQNAGNFGSTIWLFEVFDRYIAGEVIDLASELELAQQTTQEFVTCTAEIEPLDPSDTTNIESFQEQIQACLEAANTGF